MADGSLQPGSEGPLEETKRKNEHKEPLQKAKNEDIDLPLERDRLLSQIEGVETSELKKKRRRRRKRRRLTDQAKEQPKEVEKVKESFEENDVSLKREEIQNQKEEQKDKEIQSPEIEKEIRKVKDQEVEEEVPQPKKKRRRRRRRRKKAEDLPKDSLSGDIKQEKLQEGSVTKEEVQPSKRNDRQGMTFASGFEEDISKPFVEENSVEIEDARGQKDMLLTDQSVEEPVQPFVVPESNEEIRVEESKSPENEEEPSLDSEDKKFVDSSDTVTELESESKFITEREPTLESESTLVVEPEAESESKLGPEVESESGSEVELKPDLESESELESESALEPEPEIQSVVEVESETFAQPHNEEEGSQPYEPPATSKLEREESIDPLPEDNFSPLEEEEATIPAESKIELAPEDETSNLPPVSLKRAKEEEKIISQEYQEMNVDGVQEVVPSGEEALEVVPESGSVESYTAEQSESMEETPEEIQEKIDEKKAELRLEDTMLTEKRSLLDSLRLVMEEVSPTLGKVFNARVIGGLVVLIFLVWGGFSIFSHNFFGLFDGGVDSSDRPFRSSDQVLMDQYGLATNLLFGMNEGSEEDSIPASLRIADYFGNRSERQIEGETGISAATYYGELLDEQEIVNQFVEYVRMLEILQNLYSVDVYAMLDRTTARDQSLVQYLEQLRKAEDEGGRMLQSVRLHIDELTISFKSVDDEKDIFENDFFAALNDLEPEKSDALLKSFVDVSQKQVALRARVAALSKVASFYDTALGRLRERIDAVDNNQQALVQGIRVVEVPGSSELELIIRP